MRDRADPAESRFAALFDALSAAGVHAEPVVYNDQFVEEVRTQSLSLDGLLVWHNPIEGGRSRAVLDAMLRDLAKQGVFVSAHPDSILSMGTKDVLLAVRDLPFGSDAVRVADLAALRDGLPARLTHGARVLKQHRGHSGIGVWRVAACEDGLFSLRHAQRGSTEEFVEFETVVTRLAPYFEQGGHMIDQAWQPRLVEGMTRAYLVRDRVAGFGHQEINALYPTQAGGAPLQPSTRLYSGPNDSRFQSLRRLLEDQWVALLCERTRTPNERLPLLWDADFIPGARAGAHVLCEINVSSVSPFPETAIDPLVQSLIASLDA
jgi:hypothetical protein